LWKQCQGEQRFILAEHTYGANAVGMLADRKTVFSAGNDKFVRLWDFESRRPIGMLPHSAAIGGAAASPDGRWLATASYKRTEGQPVLLWDLVTQKAATLTTTFWVRDQHHLFTGQVARRDDVRRRSCMDGAQEVTNLLSINDGSGASELPFSPTAEFWLEKRGGAFCSGHRQPFDDYRSRSPRLLALAFAP
jgi:WD40 repeat protein